jgi:hypothetical protein
MPYRNGIQSTYTFDGHLEILAAEQKNKRISLFYRAFQFTMCNGPTNALVCNKTIIQMPHIKTLKISPTRFDHQGAYLILVKIR